MQAPDVRNKFYLYGSKIVLLLTILLVTANTVQAQKKIRWVKKNNPNYDEKKLTYGFLIGLHTTAYQIKYSDLFITQDFDTVTAVSIFSKRFNSNSFNASFCFSKFFISF